MSEGVTGGVRVGGGLTDSIGEALRSTAVRVLLLLIAVAITIMGYITYHPQHEGIIGFIVTILESYWKGFDVLARIYISDESIAFMVAFIIRTLFTIVILYSFIRPITTVEFVSKILIIITLLLAFIVVLYAVVNIVAPNTPVLSTIVDWVKSWIHLH